MLNLMYITNRPDVALIAEAAGVDRIFVDLEYIGKADRQGGMDTVQNHHTVADVSAIREVLTAAELLVRVNPIHEATAEYESSEEEINAVISAGAQTVMLPFFKTVAEVRRFVLAVGGRARTMLLFETPESVENLDEILAIHGVDEVFIGLNDLSLGYGMKFMFELLADGTVARICERFKRVGLPYGFGGIASLGQGMLPSEYVIREHYKLHSGCAILSRSFCNASAFCDAAQIESIFTVELAKIRAFETECAMHPELYEDGEREMRERVCRVVAELNRQTGESV